MPDHSGRQRRRGAVTPRKATKSGGRVTGDYRPRGQGIDTCAVVLRPQRLRSLDRLESLPYTGSPDRRLLCRGTGDSRLIFFPSFGVIRFEGRATAIVRDDVDNHELASPGVMPDVARAGALLLAEFTGELLKDAETARLDIAADLKCTRDDGLALLRSLRHVNPARSKIALYENAGDRSPETVMFVTRKRGQILLRAYDKGLESGGAPRGEWIRLERQLRVDRGRRRRVENIDGAYLSAQWASHMRKLSESARDASVGTATTLLEVLAERVREGTLTAARARSLLGAAYLLPELERDLTDRTAQRWRADLQAEGIQPIRDDLSDLREVPLPALLREVAGRFEALEAIA